MTRRLFNFCAITALLVSTAAAQQMSRGLVIDVPFPFTAGKTLLDAGVYNVTTPTAGAIRISKTGGPSVFLIGVPQGRKYTDREAKAVFNKYGEKYFLSQIWNLQDTIGMAVPRSKEEKELRAKSDAPTETRTVLARR